MTGLDDLEVAGGQSPLEQAIGRESLERYDRALERLKPEEREAIIARLEMGYSYDEMAEMLGKPTGDALRKASRPYVPVRLLVDLPFAVKPSDCC